MFVQYSRMFEVRLGCIHHRLGYSEACFERSARGQIASFVEIIRDGDLAMRRFFGPRTRETLRVRSGELLTSFDLHAISAATKARAAVVLRGVQDVLGRFQYF